MPWSVDGKESRIPDDSRGLDTAAVLPGLVAFTTVRPGCEGPSFGPGNLVGSRLARPEGFVEEDDTPRCAIVARLRVSDVGADERWTRSNGSG